jgi:hypothetical protein
VRVTLARVLLALCAASALVAGATSLAALDDSPDASRMADTWWAVGVVTFAGLFALLAWRPLALPGLWELTIANKAALTGFAAAYGDEADGASTSLVTDGVLTVVLVVAYVAARGWRAWSGATASRPGRSAAAAA